MTGFSLATWIGFVISFVSAPISTRLFSPDQLGRINLFNIGVNLLLALSLLGLDQALVRFYYEPPSRTNKKYLLSILTLVSTLVLLFGGLIIVLFFWRPVSFSIIESHNQLIVICLVLSSISAVVLRYLNLFYRLEQKILWFNIQAILIAIFTRVLYLGTGFWSPTYMPAILVLTGTNLLLMISFLLIQRKEFEVIKNLPDKNFVKTIAAFAVPLIPVTVIAWVNNSVSALVISRLLNFAEVAIFTVAASLAGLVSIIQAGFNTYWAPYVYQNYKENSHRFWIIHKLIACCLTLFGLMIILLQEPAFMLLGEKYRGAVLFFPFLLIAPICYTLGETTGIGINIAKKTYWSPIILISSILANIVICLTLIPLIGISGAAIASAFAGIVSVILKTVIGRKYYTHITSYKYLVITIILLVVASFIGYVFVDNRILKHILLSLILLLGIYIYRKEIVILLKNVCDIVKAMTHKPNP